jgi:hypothetical protein
MSLMVIISTFLAIVILAVTIWFWADRRLCGAVDNVSLRAFHTFLEQLAGNQSEYHYYTTGNIVWSETSISEIEKTIRASTVIPAFGSGIGFNPRYCHYDVDEKSKRVYFVSSSEQMFDWSSVTHYEDYLKTE